MLNEFEAYQLLEGFGIPFPPSQIAHSPEQAVRAVSKVGPPAVMKILSPHIPHKSAIGGVIFNVTPQEAADRYTDLLHRVRQACPNAFIQGVLVQRQYDLRSGVELIVGGLRDPYFGSVVMVGAGGKLAELLEDVSFRVIPISHGEALSMLAEIKVGGCLRSMPGIQDMFPRVANLVLAVCQILLVHPQISELDINPLFIGKEEVVALDALIRIDHQLQGEGDKGGEGESRSSAVRDFCQSS